MAGQAVKDQAFVTLATNDTYALGAMVLGHSLRGAGTTRQLAVMITHGVSETIRGQLSQVFDLVAIVDVLDSQDVVNLALLTRTDLGVTFTKLHCWRLTQYSKCVFMDADTMVLSNIDELFDREELSAAPDAGWPDCFNSGVFVFKPSDVTYKALLDFAVSHGSFDGGDQGLLNLYFSDWATKDIKRHLPFLYNVVSQAFYSYLPAFTRFGKNIKVVHFIGAVKPWHHTFNTATGQVDIDGDAGHNKDFLQKWWQLFLTNVQPNLDPEVKLVTTTEKLSDPLWSWQTPVSDIHYEMTSPYNPPDVQIFYEPRSPDVADRRESVVVDNKDDRNYDFYESFYAEPPMSHSECYPTPSQTYTAKHFHNTLVEWSQESADQVVDPVDEIEQDIDSDFVEVPVDLEDDVNNPDHADHDISNSSCIHSDAKQYSSDDKETDNSCYHSEEVVFDDRTVVSPRLDKDDQVHISPDEHCDKSTVAHNHVSEPPSQSSNITVSKTEESSAINEETNLTVPKASEELEPDTKCSDTAVIGLVGEMASLRLETVGGYTRDQLADRQRQYDWEMGQVDYRGIDAFQNIQHRLTEAMTGPPPEVTFGAVPAKDTTSADKS